MYKNTKPKRTAALKPDRKLKSTASKQTVTQKEEEVFKSIGPEETVTSCGETLKKPPRKKKQSGDEAGESASVSARKLKIGTEMTAKVHQVRTHGLVLDLGGGIRGMYKFEVCFRTSSFFTLFSYVLNTLYCIVCLLLFIHMNEYRAMRRQSLRLETRCR